MTGLCLTICGGLPSRPDDPLAKFIAFLSAEDRAEMERASGVKHARFLGTAACLAATAGTVLVQRLGLRRTGLICTGGPWAVPACSSFIERASQAGPWLVNPIQFPATLTSATATAVAALLGAHAFAYVTGFDRLAFFDALRRAERIMRYGLAEQVLVLAISSGASGIDSARQLAGVARPSLDVSIGFGIGTDAGQSVLRLLEVHIPVRPGVVRRDWKCYDTEWPYESVDPAIPPSLAHGEAYGAGGAVLCIAAARHHAATAPDPRLPFAVSVRADGRSAAAVFQFVGENYRGFCDC